MSEPVAETPETILARLKEAADEEIARLKAQNDEEISRLRTELAAARGQAAAPAQDGPPPEPTHDLLLANGQMVEHYGGIPTHVDTGEGVFRVLAVTERQAP